jgi:hypothetical protein
VKVVRVEALEAAGPLTSGKVEVEHAMATEECARLREKGEHAGEVYHGTGAEDVEWEAAWSLMKLSPAVHGRVYVLVAAVSSSLVLR